MLGEALKFWDNQRQFEVMIGENTLEQSVEVYKKREAQFKDRLNKYKQVRRRPKCGVTHGYIFPLTRQHACLITAGDDRCAHDGSTGPKE